MAQSAAQYVPEAFAAPPQPSGAVAWGSRDWERNVLPVWTPDGLWFVLDMKTFKRIPIQAPSEEPLTEAEMLAQSHEMADEADTIAVCYFIGGDDGPVKIGYSVNVRDRLRTLQMSSPVELKVLATASGGAQREAAYHWQFADHRLHGEWFCRVSAIVAEIERLKTLNAPPPNS